MILWNRGVLFRLSSSWCPNMQLRAFHATYCIYYHTRAAKAFGASEAEIKAAVAAAADTRMWSTVLNGNAYDMDEFIAEVDSLIPSN